MAKRVLLVLTTNDDGASATRDVAGVARAAGGTVRVMYVHPLPRPRVDRYGRIVADVDREMARLTTRALTRLEASTAARMTMSCSGKASTAAARRRVRSRR